MNVSWDIDIVYTWVDHDQKHRTHQQNHQPHVRHKRFLPQDAQVAGRFRCNGEIEESIKSVLAFAPWVRKIHVVCADYQSPDFLRPLSPKIHIVHHSTIYGDAMRSHLPTFNSHSIECHLHKVPGLSERFIYSNDDTFMGAPCSPSLFFDGQGRPRCIMSGKRLQSRHPGRSKESYLYARYNLSQVLRKLFPDRTYWPRHSHQMKPLTRTLYGQMWNHPVLRPWLIRTSKTRFRSTGDIWPVGLALYYGLGQGDVVQGSGKTRYFSIQNKTNMREVFQAIRKNRYHMYCLNDALQNASSRVLRAYRHQLKTSLPHTILFDQPHEKTPLSNSKPAQPQYHVWTVGSKLPQMFDSNLLPSSQPSTSSPQPNPTAPSTLSSQPSTSSPQPSPTAPSQPTRLTNPGPVLVEDKKKLLEVNVSRPVYKDDKQTTPDVSPATTVPNPKNERNASTQASRDSRRLKRPPVKRFLTDKKSTLRRRLKQMKKRTLLRLQIK